MLHNEMVSALAPKRAIPKWLHMSGLEIFRSPSLAHFLVSRDVDLVFDEGANIGQFALGLRDCGYRGKILSFEPVKSAFCVCQDKAKSDRTAILKDGVSIAEFDCVFRKI